MKGGWMQIEIDLTSKVPIYVQIIDHIKHMIATGVLRPDDQLPTVRQLATDLRVNFNTIARAYRMLDDEGLISTQHGRGTYILPMPSEENGEFLKRQDLEWLTRHYLNEVAQLGYSAEEVNQVLETYINLWREHGIPPAEHDN
jgi:GntR family transcriptional regulator